ncbi:MAG: redoxin domain-containing protein [Acidobacteria bacterium]|nr:redoxin domain-containing protein [Acidobacteriota bacterium]MBI3428315.1 redoxin domain-containing protein [Acidobacteriota bacterium]
MKIGTALPSFAGATEWLTGNADAIEASVGQPTLVHFWAVSCGICKDNMPKVTDWRAQYADKGLRVVAVHMPRYPADTDVAAVKAARAQYQITKPCAVDNEHKLRDAFQNEQGFVPAYYLFNAEGQLKSFAVGQFGPQIIKSALERMFDR